MSLLHSWQNPSSTSSSDLFQSSFPIFHGVCLHKLSYNSSISFRRRSFYVNHNSVFKYSHAEKYPSRNSSFIPRNTICGCHQPVDNPIARCPLNDGLSNSRWKHKWNVTHGLKLPKRPQAVLDYPKSDGVSRECDDDREEMNGNGNSFITCNSKMGKIVEKLRGFGYADEEIEKERVPRENSLMSIFYKEERRTQNLRDGLPKESRIESGNEFRGDGNVWTQIEESLVKEEEDRNLVRRKSKTSLAELTLSGSELRRLRHLSVRTEEAMEIGVSGVTQAIVDMIHEKWRMAEVVRLKCDSFHAYNMKRMHEILERKTGGLVVWRSATSVSIYRGVSYEVPSASMQQERNLIQKKNADSDTVPTDKNNENITECNSVEDAQLANAKKTNELEPLPEIEYEYEVDKLLEGLGPRYTDWPGGNPLPVDADLLPGVVPGYKPPFRVLPYGVRSTLGNKEATALRRLATILPPHFAIGRSRQHEGLAVAMAKLWEKSSIAKIALKRGVPLTAVDRMVEDIKKVTGGTIVTINKDYIVFFRGKDFLSSDVAEALVERERLAKALQDREEQARLKASSLVIPCFEETGECGAAGTLGETLKASAQWGNMIDYNQRNNMLRAAKVARHAKHARKLEEKLSTAERKLMMAERALVKIEAFLSPPRKPRHSESITEEERFMFRKIGLRMNAFHLLGRRGVFDGTLESVHMHWKYRELVKIVVKARTLNQVSNIASVLEVESGGILVSVDKISEGFAIILFRGKNYKQPSVMRPKNLLTKRRALARSIELQRYEALYKHISALEKTVDNLRSELDQMDEDKQLMKAMERQSKDSDPIGIHL